MIRPWWLNDTVALKTSLVACVRLEIVNMHDYGIEILVESHPLYWSRSTVIRLQVCTLWVLNTNLDILEENTSSSSQAEVWYINTHNCVKLVKLDKSGTSPVKLLEDKSLQQNFRDRGDKTQNSLMFSLQIIWYTTKSWWVKKIGIKIAYTLFRLLSSPISLGMGPDKAGLLYKYLHMSTKKSTII